DGIARIGCERVVTWIEESQVEGEDRLLGTERRDDLSLRVKRHVKGSREEVTYHLAKVGAAAIGRVLVSFSLRDSLLHRLDNQRRRRPVGVANAKTDHVDSSRALLGDLALKLGERIRRYALQALTRFH